MTIALCSVRGLGFSYPSSGRDQLLLERVNFELQPGEILGCLGESGVGKSTLLSIMAGEFQANDGEVELEAGCGSRIAFFRQFDTLISFRNLAENALLLTERGTQAENSQDDDPFAMLKEVFLADRALDYPETLSGGMRQRVQLAQCLASFPRLLLLDEPFSQQDLITQIKLEELVFRTVKSYNSAAIVISHDLGALAALCDKVIALGGQPASIHSSLDIDGELGTMSPQHRRNSKDYAALLTKLWDMRLAASQC